MKKGLLVVSIIVVVVAVLGLAGYAVAQVRGVFINRAPLMMNNQRGAGPGMFNDFRGNGRGAGPMDPMWYNWQNSQSPMHTYMLDAIAKALDVTTTDLQTQLNNGSSLWQIAQGKGMTEAQFQTAMQTAFSEALKQAVADGKLTQAQADWMSAHMQGWDDMFGPGFPMMGPGGRMNRGRP